ncbi:MAG: hypothetical protein JNK15_21780 [Planctomycetes bacterium]|nr:hypothetical protein [Planctomycetota bacterium]
MTTVTTYDVFCDRCNAERMQGARGHLSFRDCIPHPRAFGWRRNVNAWAIICDECVHDLELSRAPLFGRTAGGRV